MLIDISFAIIIFIYLLIGIKRGFVLEFFMMFKYILTIIISQMMYQLLENTFKYSKMKDVEKLKLYLIIFFILYMILSIILIFSKKFLKTIRLKKLDSQLGMIFGIIKATFLIFVIYSGMIIFSTQNKSFHEEVLSSKSIYGITTYLYSYSELFPKFIQKELEKYRRKQVEKELRDDILNEIKENKIDEKDENDK